MRTGLVMSTGIMGVLLLIIVFILAIVLKIRGVKITPISKAILRFFVILYSITAFICLIGSGLGFLELCPIPILWIINFVPVSTAFSAIYINKSKRFKPAE